MEKGGRGKGRRARMTAEWLGGEGGHQTWLGSPCAIHVPRELSPLYEITCLDALLHLLSCGEVIL